MRYWIMKSAVATLVATGMFHTVPDAARLSRQDRAARRLVGPRENQYINFPF